MYEAFGLYCVCCICDSGPCHLSCLGSSVGRALGLESRVSWVRVPPEAAHFSLEKELCHVVLCLVVLYCIVLPCLLSRTMSCTLVYMYNVHDIVHVPCTLYMYIKLTTYANKKALLRA